MELLSRRLPPTKMAEGLRDDDAFAERLIAAWAADGVMIRATPQLLAGLLRALFFVGLHADEIDPAVYPEVIGRMIAMIADDIA